MPQPKKPQSKILSPDDAPVFEPTEHRISPPNAEVPKLLDRLVAIDNAHRGQKLSAKVAAERSAIVTELDSLRQADIGS